MTAFEIFVGIAGLVVGYWAIQLYVPDAKEKRGQVTAAEDADDAGGLHVEPDAQDTTAACPDADPVAADADDAANSRDTTSARPSVHARRDPP